MMKEPQYNCGYCGNSTKTNPTECYTIEARDKCPHWKEGGRAPNLQVGDLVKKRKGYLYPGIVVSIFHTQAGLWRYVVEADDPNFEGMLHIFSLDQLEKRK